MTTANEENKEVVQPVDAEDDFDKAFAEIAAIAAGEKVEKPAEDKEKGEETPKPEEKPADTAVAPTEATAKPAATPEPTPPAAPAPAQQPAPAAPAAPAPAKPVEAPRLEAPKLAPEAEAMLAEFEKEWPEHAKAMRTMLEHQAAKSATDHANAMAFLAAELDKRQAPMFDAITQTAYDKHMATLRGAHPDIDSLVHTPQGGKSKLKAWIDSQPRVLQAAWERVYNEGTTPETLELVEAYKKSTGISAGSQTPSASTQEQPERAAAIAALAPVSSKRASPSTQGVDKDDFDGAFEEFAAASVKARG